MDTVKSSTGIIPQARISSTAENHKRKISKAEERKRLPDEFIGPMWLTSEQRKRQSGEH